VQKKQERTALLATKTVFNIEGERFIIDFPEEVKGEISGKLIFFKPSSQKDDKSIDFKTSSGNFELAIAEYSSGMYKVNVSWEANGVEYYNEDEIVIP